MPSLRAQRTAPNDLDHSSDAWESISLTGLMMPLKGLCPWTQLQGKGRLVCCHIRLRKCRSSGALQRPLTNNWGKLKYNEERVW